MNLSEKILHCRKGAGLSQEALAERIGVSRQAVSKWETGDAVPEISKLVLLADVFEVSTDWLLREGEHATKPAVKPETERTWVDAVPGVIGRLVRTYGWLFGVYMAVVGGLFSAMGGLARYAMRWVLGDMSMGMPHVSFTGPGGPERFGFQSSVATRDPVSIMGSFIMGLGIVIMIVGVILAVALKRRSYEGE